MSMFFRKLIPYSWRPRQLWLQLRNFLWDRYSTVRPRTLGHGWVDRDMLLEHIMFEILGQFLEKECGPDGIIDWDADEEHRAAMAEMRELWRWWKEHQQTKLEYPELPPESVSEIAPGIFESKWEFESSAAEEAYEEAAKRAMDEEMARRDELTSRLKRLVDVRRFMWT